MSDLPLKENVMQIRKNWSMNGCFGVDTKTAFLLLPYFEEYTNITLQNLFLMIQIQPDLTIDASCQYFWSVSKK